MARPKKQRVICARPKVTKFAPMPLLEEETVTLTMDEYEVIRLHDLERLEQSAVASQMLVSRPTVAALLSSARAKLADAITHGKVLQIEQGDCAVCEIGCQCSLEKRAGECDKRHRCGAYCRKNQSN